jgi:phthalate 4,5-dioxygenase oxygenase subunit
MKREDNNLLTQTDAGTAMGELFRRYWLPALTVSELPDADCPPVRIPMLGEQLLAFRDSNGRVGIIEEACAHRRASLYFGRVEDCGIRCAYHGWHFDVNGRCLDIPSEPAENKFRDRVRLKAYPTLERGGVIWVYMGAADAEPPAPALTWANLPEEKLFVSKRLQECNYFQVMEGGLDSSHLSFLHRGTLSDDPVMGTGGLGRDSRIQDILAADHNPRYETVETDGGLMLGARRDAGDAKYYWRVTQFIFPCFNIIAPLGDLSLNAQAWVPMDDYNCWSWAINYHPHRALNAEEREFMRKGGGLHVEFVPGTHQGSANRANDYAQDRKAQREGVSFTGIPSFAMQDTAVQESQGPIADRSAENLVSSDDGIIVTRRRLLSVARANLGGEAIPGLDSASQSVKAASIIAEQESLADLPADTF